MPATRRKALRPHEKGAIVAWVAGLLMLVAGVSGASTWRTLRALVESAVGGGILVDVVFFLLIVLSSLGGILVILGGFRFRQKAFDSGRILVFLGSGMGLLGLLIFIAVHLVRGAIPGPSLHWVGFVGVVLAVASRSVAEG